MARNLIIFGTGKFAEVACTYFDEYSDYNIAGFFAKDAEYFEKPRVLGKPVCTFEELHDEFPPHELDIFVAIGYKNMNNLRKVAYEKISKLGYTFASFVHPNVHIWDDRAIGNNVFIFEDNTIQPFVTIGNNSVLWSGNHIGHHSTIKNHCFISSHVVVSGNCQVGNNVFMGVNSSTHDDIVLGDYTMVGAGT